MDNTAGVTSGEETDFPSGTPNNIPIFSRFVNSWDSKPGISYRHFTTINPLTLADTLFRDVHIQA